MKRKRSWLIWGEVGLLVGSVASAQIQLVDVAEDAGLVSEEIGDFISAGGHGLGVNWIDYDDDGWVDIFAVGGRPDSPPHLFRNLGDGTFERVDHLLGELPAVEMSGSRFADYDRDCDLDLFVYTDNEDFSITEQNLRDGPPNLLLKNLWVENGRQTIPDEPLFVDVAAEVGLDDLAVPAWGPLPAYRTKTAAWFDYDRDGCIDLYVGHFVVNGGGDTANADRLQRNRCDGTFEDVTLEVGLRPTAATEARPALASGAFHLDGDLWPDLAVINASLTDPQPFHDDQFFRNLGPSSRGTAVFEDIVLTAPWLGDDAQAGMGVDVADLDRDGDWDIYITDLFNTISDELPLGNVLYLGDGAGGFSDNLAEDLGVEGVGSWGINIIDLDHDGWEDLFIATIVSERLYRNLGTDEKGELQFVDVAEDLGIVTGGSRGSAVADYDRDGDLDVLLVNHRGPLQLFRNDSPPGNHWLMIELEGSASNLDAIGAMVEAQIGDVILRRQVKGGSSAHSQDDLPVHFGLGTATVVDLLTVYWPSGQVVELHDVGVDQRLVISETLIFSSGFESGDLLGWSVPSERR